MKLPATARLAAAALARPAMPAPVPVLCGDGAVVPAPPAAVARSAPLRHHTATGALAMAFDALPRVAHSSP